MMDKIHTTDRATMGDLAEMFRAICGEAYVNTRPDELRSYGSDGTMDLHYSFDILVIPASPEEISSILKICHRYKVPVTPRGGGSGVTGGALPVYGGVVLSLERLSGIIAINRTDRYVVAESGVVTADLCAAVAKEGLYFPASPSSAAYSFIGGNVAENAGSIYSCKYGVTEDYVLNLEVVLATGEILWTGANVAKNATGLNLTKLFVGSEGTLGVITKVVYRLVEMPAGQVTLLAGFGDIKDACDALTALKRSAIQPACVELIGSNAIELVSGHLNKSLPLVSEGVKAHLLVGFEETDTHVLDHSVQRAAEIIQPYIEADILVAESPSDRRKLWELRYSIGDALNRHGYSYRDIDACLEVSYLFEYIRFVEEVCREDDVTPVYFGHAQDGNLHVMLVIDKSKKKDDDLIRVATKIFQYVTAHGGVLSGEHGIGILQRDFLPLQFSEVHIELMKNVKRVFDPHSILNAGKAF